MAQIVPFERMYDVCRLDETLVMFLDVHLTSLTTLFIVYLILDLFCYYTCFMYLACEIGNIIFNISF